MKGKYLSLLLVIVVLITACSPEFLDVEPKGKSFGENFYSTEDEVYRGLNAAYDFLVRDYAAGGDAEGHAFNAGPHEERSSASFRAHRTAHTSRTAGSRTF